MPFDSLKNRKLGRAALCAALGAILILTGSFSSATAADDDDDPSLDVKILRGFLKGIGLRKPGEESGIDYRERSPLVVPPSTNLPPPETGSVAERNPAWPVDQDIKRAKDAKRRQASKTQSDSAVMDEARPLSPSEMQSGQPRGGRPQDTSGNPDREFRPASPTELGFKGWSLGLLFGKKEEAVPFTGEPPRNDLTKPPSGYQTPSANYPYGVGQSREKGQATTFEDRVAGDRR
jgi:hypothetical protein